MIHSEPARGFMIQFRGVGRSWGADLIALVATLVVGACGEPDPEAVSVALLDSAGVPVVENTGPVGGGEPRWRLSRHPRLSIGAADGPPEVTLSRVAGALRLKDGRIVVADGGSRSLRFYDATGAHLGTVGREGGGPGEFLDLAAIGRFAGDSLAVWDAKSHRLSIFDAQGELVRAIALSTLGLSPRFVGSLDDGSFVLTPGVDPYRKMSERRLGEYRDTATFLRFGPDGSLLDTLGPFPGTELFVSQGGVVTMHERVRFGRDFRLAVGRSRLYGGDTDAFEIRVLTRNGTLERIIRLSQSPGVVLDRHLSAARVADDTEDEFAEMPPAMRAALEAAAAERRDIPSRRTFPAFATLLEDTEERLWVSAYPRPLEPGVYWSVFDTTGLWKGSVELPASARLLDAGDNHVLLLETDELGVERVLLYPLEEMR